MVFYRKYRPQTLTDLLGQQVVKDTLFKAFQSGKLAHAYLFCGPRGVGKTSTARLLAKLVNCEASVFSDQLSEENKSVVVGSDQLNSDNRNIPCNACPSCISITDGSNLDLIEIDAASNRGIDDIRELRDKVKLSPSSAKKKVYIIDEVHMLTTEAFNALLKTLEEPPAHVLFILATTEVHKIPQTILSRVQKLEFQEATRETMIEALKKVVDAEKIEIEEDALAEIASRAEGSFRDGLKLLDQIASSGEKITLSLVEQTTRSGTFEQSFDLLSAISQKKVEIALAKTVEISSTGTNMKEFIHGLMEMLRAVLFIQNNVTLHSKSNFGQLKFEKLQVLATQFSKEDVVRVLSLLQEAQEKMRYTSISSLPLEIAIVESSLEKKIDRVVSTEIPQLVIPPQSSTQFSDIPNKSSMMSGMTIDEDLKKDQKGAKDDVVSPLVEKSEGDDLPKLMDKWTYVLETIKPYNYSLEALLRQVNVLSCLGGVVELEVPYSFHQRILEAQKSRTLLESVLSEVLGKSARIICTLSQRPIKVEEIANVELAADDEVIKIASEIFNS